MRVIKENIAWNLRQANLILDAGERSSPQQRSGYYKASLLLVASAVEAMVFMIVKQFCTKNPDTVTYRPTYTYRPLYRLPISFLKNKDTSIALCEERKESFVWKDIIDFQSLNQIGLKYKVFSQGLYNTLEKVRTQRNRIHLQSLQEKDHKYTKRDVERVFSATEKLLLLLPEK